MEVSGQLDAPAALLPWKRALGIHWTGGWVIRGAIDCRIYVRSSKPSSKGNPSLARWRWGIWWICVFEDSYGPRGWL